MFCRGAPFLWCIWSTFQCILTCLYYLKLFYNRISYFIFYILIYRVIKKSLCTWWLQYRKLQVMFKVSPASLQTFIDTANCFLTDRVQYSTVHIVNVFCDGRLQIINCVGIVHVQKSGAHRLFDHPVYTEINVTQWYNRMTELSSIICSYPDGKIR
jgi:hypothetical protein